MGTALLEHIMPITPKNPIHQELKPLLFMRMRIRQSLLQHLI
jgi:hypothetical protein